jgi:hypothetical protein
VDAIQSAMAWMNQNAGVAGWAQAVGGVLAVVAAFWFPWRQSLRDARLRAAERRTRDLAHASALRWIAREAEEAVRGLVDTLRAVPLAPPQAYGFPLPDHPQLKIFAESVAELMPRIAALSQQPDLSDEQINALFAIRGGLKDARVLFDGVHDPYREFNALNKRRADGILARMEALRAATQTAYAAMADRS